MALVAASAGILFGASVGGIAMFLSTNDERFDRVAEWAFVAFAIASSVLILTTSDRVGAAPPVRAILIALGIASVAAVGLGELGTALRLVDYRRIALVVTAGFMGFLVWVGVLSLLLVIGDHHDLPTGLGWLGLAAIAVGVALVSLILRQPGVMTADSRPDGRLMVGFAFPAAAIVAWLTWLGLSL